jgi:hypothetical protein
MAVGSNGSTVMILLYDDEIIEVNGLAVIVN